MLTSTRRRFCDRKFTTRAWSSSMMIPSILTTCSASCGTVRPGPAVKLHCAST
ncbi:hypothetical protein JG688_00014862 [Phytophthora aleatoria]|uniref:Uncharacterized protein n=1 Tax=Phytophthora aleatoria TaxID=2496075 RepID=A0A8J5I755_9STRA|nr:hypothetical protein JG688_00014862 [Phytophthora aleatoria]